MRTIPVQDAQARLPELVNSAAAGEEIVITRERQPVAKLVPISPQTSLRDIQPAFVGKVLRQPPQDDDLLEEMLGYWSASTPPFSSSWR